MIDKREYDKNMRHIRSAFLFVTALFFAILIAFMFILVSTREQSHRSVSLSRSNAILLKENQNRIRDEQANRIFACQHTYSGIRDVFEIFFPKKPRTEQQQRELDLFNRRIKELRSSCGRKN